MTCLACAGISLGAPLLQGCIGVKYTEGSRDNNGFFVDLADFGSGEKRRKYVILRNDDLLFPICVYDLGGGKYSALLMKCTHQGAELQVAGDQLTCPAHGSAFDMQGNVTEAPAMAPLRAFPVSVIESRLFIDMRKQA